MKMNNKSGFTLLEIIIVIIIVGVLSSLALPRLFSTIEFSRSNEALKSLAEVRGSIERCYLMTNDYTLCDTFAEIDIEDPATAPGAHFGYSIVNNGAAVGYTATATRNAVDGGNIGDTVVLVFDETQAADNVVTRNGSGAFASIR